MCARCRCSHLRTASTHPPPCAATLGQWPYKRSGTGLLPEAACKRVTLQLLRQAAYFHLM